MELSMRLVLLVVIAAAASVMGDVLRHNTALLNVRGGATVEGPPPPELLQQLEKDHARECRDSPYWQCHEGDEADKADGAEAEAEAVPPVSFKSYEMIDWTLPDFDDIFDHNSLVYVSKEPIFSKEECANVIQSAEDYFKDNTPDGKWTHLPSGRFQIDGFWIKDVPPVKEWFDRQLKEKLFPTLVKLFPEFVDKISKLAVDSAYVFKYTPETGKKSDIHTDSGCLSFTISLNPKEEYEGGGTWFETLGPNGTIIEMDVGQVTFRPGGVRHQGNAITSGQRYIIGGFMMHKNKVELVRRMLNKGTQYAQAGPTEKDKALSSLQYAVDLNKHFDGSRVTLADTLKRNGELHKATLELQMALSINPRNVEALYSLGEIKKDSNLKEAAALFERVIAVDSEDMDAMFSRGEVAGLEGDNEVEVHWYRTLLSHDPFLQHKLAGAASCNLGVALGMLGRIDEEQDYLRQSLDINPNQFFASYSLGSSLATAGDFQGAVEVYRHVLTLDTPPNLPDGHNKTLKQLYIASAMLLKQNGAQYTRAEAQTKLQEMMGADNLAALLRLQGR